MAILAENKKVNFEYDIQSKFEAGLVLEGWEVKSIKNGSAVLVGAFVTENSGELFLSGMAVASWSKGEPKSKEQQNRKRKVLLKKREITKILAELKQPGITVVPFQIISNERGILKVILAVVKGRKKFDKRQKLKERDLNRRVDSDRKTYNF